MGLWRRVIYRDWVEVLLFRGRLWWPLLSRVRSLWPLNICQVIGNNSRGRRDYMPYWLMGPLLLPERMILLLLCLLYPVNSACALILRRPMLLVIRVLWFRLPQRK